MISRKLLLLLALTHTVAACDGPPAMSPVDVEGERSAVSAAFAVFTLTPPTLGARITISGKSFEDCADIVLWLEWGLNPDLSDATQIRPGDADYSVSCGVATRAFGTFTALGAVRHYYRVIGSMGADTVYGAIEIADTRAPLVVNLHIVEYFPHRVRLAWEQPDGAALRHWLVLRREKGSVDWDTVTLRPTDNGPAYTDTGLEQLADRYEWSVATCNRWGCSEPAAPVSFEWPQPSVRNLRINWHSTTTVSLAWIDESDAETAMTMVKQWSGGTTSKKLPADQTHYEDVNVRADREYTYFVVASNAGAADTTNTVTVTPGQFPPGAPAPFTGPVVIKMNGAVRATGSVLTNGSETEVWFRWSTSPDLVVSDQTAHQFIPNGPAAVSFEGKLVLPTAGTYYYQAIARNSAGTVRGEIESFTYAVPAAPTGATATVGSDGIVTLNWSHSGVNLARFIVERTTRVPGTLAELQRSIRTYRDSTYDTRDDTHGWDIRACNALGCGTTHVMLGGLGLAIEDFRIVHNGGSQIGLAWTDNNSTEQGYRVRRTSAGQTITVATLPPNATSFTDSSVQPGVQYSYKLVVFNAVGRATSANITATAQP